MSKVIWLSGLSGSGKSTLAGLLMQDLNYLKLSAFHLDGDALRNGLCSDLGFSDQDRLENIRRAAEVANLLREIGFIVVCSFITPLEQHRRLVRSIVGESHCKPIHIKCRLDECARRDPKGLYQKVREGKISSFTGISSVFETPESAFLEIDTEALSIPESRHVLLSALTKEIPALAELVASPKVTLTSTGVDK